MFPRLVPAARATQNVSAKPGAANTLNAISSKKATRRGGAKRTAKKKAQAAAEAYLVTQSVAALTAPPSVPIVATNGQANGNGYHPDPHTAALRQANMDAMMAAMSAAQQEPVPAAPSRTSDRPPHPSHLVGVVDVSFLPPAGSPSKGKVNYGKVEAIVPFAFGEEHMPPEFMSSPFAEPTPKPNNIKFGPSGPTVSFNHFLEPHEQRLIGGKWVRPPRAESLLHGGGLTDHIVPQPSNGQANGALNFGTHYTPLVGSQNPAPQQSHSAPAITRTLGSTQKSAGLTAQQAAHGGVPTKVVNGVVLEPLLPSFNFRAGSPAAMSLSTAKKESNAQKIARESKERKAKIQTSVRAETASPQPARKEAAPQPVVAAATPSPAPAPAPAPVVAPPEPTPAPAAAEPPKE